MSVDFNFWLLDPRNQPYRVVLVEIIADSGTYRLATQPYYADDGPYDDLILDQIIGERRLGKDVSAGDFTFVDNYRMHWQKETFRGRACRLYFGDVRWPRTDFAKLAELVIEHIQRVRTDVYQVTFSDAIPVLEEKIIGTIQGGQKLPVAFGSPKNVTPVMIDYATRKYRFCEGDFITVAVRDKGLAVSHTKQPATGSVTLTYDPYGQVTGDVTTTKTTLRDVVAALLTRAGIATNPTDIVLRNFPAAYPDGQPLDLFYTDEPSYREVLDALAEATGSARTRLADGRYAFTYLNYNASPTLTLYADELLEITENGCEKIYKSIEVKYDPNYTVQSPGELASVGTGMTLALVTQYGKDYYTTLSQASGYTGAIHDGTFTKEVPMGAVGAGVELTRLATQYGKLRRNWRLKAVQTAIFAQEGDTIRVECEAYTGNLLVTAVTTNYTSLIIDIEGTESG